MHSLSRIPSCSVIKTASRFIYSLCLSQSRDTILIVLSRLRNLNACKVTQYLKPFPNFIVNCRENFFHGLIIGTVRLLWIVLLVI